MLGLTFNDNTGAFDAGLEGFIAGLGGLAETSSGDPQRDGDHGHHGHHRHRHHHSGSRPEVERRRRAITRHEAGKEHEAGARRNLGEGREISLVPAAGRPLHHAKLKRPKHPRRHHGAGKAKSFRKVFKAEHAGRPAGGSDAQAQAAMSWLDLEIASLGQAAGFEISGDAL